jgi:hypothetical protein
MADRRAWRIYFGALAGLEARGINPTPAERCAILADAEERRSFRWRETFFWQQVHADAEPSDTIRNASWLGYVEYGPVTTVSFGNRS